MRCFVGRRPSQSRGVRSFDSNRFVPGRFGGDSQGHVNPAGFGFKTDLSPTDPRIAQRQNWIADNITHEQDLPFTDRNYLGLCAHCSFEFEQIFNDRKITFGSGYESMVLVDGKPVMYPHQVAVSSDNLVWDVPTNTWGQSLERYRQRVTLITYED